MDLKIIFVRDFHNLIPPLGDFQVYVHPQVLGPRKTFIQYGFSCALAARPTMATLTFSVWPEWDFRWIGSHLEVLKRYPKACEAAAMKSNRPWLQSGIDNLM